MLFRSVEHDGELPDAQSALHHDFVAESVFDVDKDGCRVGETTFATLHGRDLT